MAYQPGRKQRRGLAEAVASADGRRDGVRAPCSLYPALPPQTLTTGTRLRLRRLSSALSPYPLYRLYLSPPYRLCLSLSLRLVPLHFRA